MPNVSPRYLRHLIRGVGLMAGLVILGCQAWRPSLPETSAPPPSAIASSGQAAAPVGQVLPITAKAIAKGQVLELEVARTQQEQSLGLMFRPELPPNRGMLFPFAPPQPVSFWMKNVPVSLDMVFLRQGQVVAIATAPPCSATPCPTYGPSGKIDQVIELRAGRAKELGLEVGDQVAVEFLDSTARVS